MKCSLGISNFLEEISSFSPSIIFLNFFALIAEEGFLISPCYSLELCIQIGIFFLFSFAFSWKSSVFTPIPKKGNGKECSNYHKIALISHTRKVMLKFFKPGFKSTWMVNFQMFKLDIEKAEDQIKWPTSTGSTKKQESFRKISTFALLIIPNPLTVWITINWKILKEMGIQNHLTCLLRNLYAGQEATVRTGHGTTDWFQIGKGICQGCILSPCLFNLYTKYIMWHAGLDELWGEIKISWRNIKTLDMKMLPF